MFSIEFILTVQVVEEAVGGGSTSTPGAGPSRIPDSDQPSAAGSSKAKTWKVTFFNKPEQQATW